MVMKETSVLRYLENIDRRVVYIFVAVSLAVPLIMNMTLQPAPMATADAFYQAVDSLEPEPGKVVLIAADWGPGTMAENKPQTMVAMEHLMRKRVPFVLISMYSLATPFLRDLPREVVARLEKEMPDEKWEYGKDWVNLGYKPGGMVMIQGIAKADNLVEHLKADASGTPLEDLPAMKEVRTVQDIIMLMEFTGLVGVFNAWVQFFQGPPFVHGCTSITIPEAFIYYSSKQIVGFFEGIAGAAWYEVLLSRNYPSRSADTVALRVNTGLSYAHLVVIAFIIIGNLGYLTQRLRRGRKSKTLV